MTIYKIIEIDIDGERYRIEEHFKGALQKKMMVLIDLFEVKDFQRCVDYIKKKFGYDDENECDEAEHINDELFQVLYDFEHGDRFK